MATKYKILVHYQTGDSFGNEDTEQFLEADWEDLDIAKGNLKRIREHYEYYKWFNDHFGRKYKNLPEPPKPDSWVEKKGFPGLPFIALLLDNKEEWVFHPFWIGYFETLYGAEIQPDDSDMKFKIQ